jgi:hypothetical protein
VDFVLVGALATVAQGAPVTTHDVEIGHARTPENLDRMMMALEKLGTRSRGRSVESPFPPDRRELATTGHSLLMTTLGPLDCLGAIEGGREFDDLVPLSTEIDVEGRRLRVLGLETIVAFKRQSTEVKDRLMLSVLEATLRERALR